MNNVFILFLSLSFWGSIFALILLALTPVVKNRFSQTWHYYVWLVVVLRFLWPFASPWRVSAEAGGWLQTVLFQPVVIADEIKAPSQMDGQLLPIPGGEGEETPVPAGRPTIAKGTFNRNPVLACLSALWFGVALALFLHKLAVNWRFVRVVKTSAQLELVTGERISEPYGKAQAIAGVKKPLPVYVNGRLYSPMLLGLIEPIIVLPTVALHSNKLQHILSHELMHYKRQDYLYKWLMQLTLCLHWFNPVAYYVAKQVNRYCELSCDEMVIRHLDKADRIAYGDALMASLQIQSNFGANTVSVHLKENAQQVKERLDAMMQYQKKSRPIQYAMALAAVLLVCGFTFTGAYRAGGTSRPAVAPDVDAPLELAKNHEFEADTPKPGYSAKPYKVRTTTIIEDFKPYIPFGVTYDPDQNAVYYNGERVKLFVVFNPYSEENRTYSFNLCYRDSAAQSTLYLEGVKDSTGAVTAIRPLDGEIAKDLLEAMGAVTAYQEDKKPPESDTKDRFYVTMDAAMIIEDFGSGYSDLRGKDFPIDERYTGLLYWIADCDKQGTGAYTRNVPGNYIHTELYYNGGGRYPWNMHVADNGDIIVNLYSDSHLATDDGYHLMTFSAFEGYNIRLFLDNEELPIHKTGYQY